MFGRFVGVILWTLAITAAAAVRTPVQSEGKVANSLLTKNDYNLMRQHRQSTVSTYYSATTPTIVIEAPDSFPEPLRSDFSARANTALETVKASANNFNELYDCLNAQDYKDDQYKKVDALKTKLVVLG